MFKGYFATQSGHLYFTDGKIIQLKSGESKPNCRLRDFQEHEIEEYSCKTGLPAFFRLKDSKILRTSNVVARFPI